MYQGIYRLPCSAFGKAQMCVFLFFFADVEVPMKMNGQHTAMNVSVKNCTIRVPQFAYKDLLLSE